MWSLKVPLKKRVIATKPYPNMIRRAYLMIWPQKACNCDICLTRAKSAYYHQSNVPPQTAVFLGGRGSKNNGPRLPGWHKSKNDILALWVTFFHPFFPLTPLPPIPEARMPQFLPSCRTKTGIIWGRSDFFCEIRIFWVCKAKVRTSQCWKREKHF